MTVPELNRLRVVERIPPNLESRVCAPGSDDYEELRHGYVHKGSPAIIIRCESAEDVISALAFARSSGLSLSVRSGGHGVASSSTNDGGIVIDLSLMNAIEVVEASSGLVRVGPGARWGEVATILDGHGLAIGSGDSGDVGVGGLTVFGGIGLLGRRYGLTIDGLRAVEIVTADGDLRHASATENADLFWAVRGAGANFGIVTSFEFIADRVRDVVHASIRYDASDAALLIERWANAVEDAPRELTGFLYLTSGGAGMPPTAECTGVYVGEDGPEARNALEPFTEIAPVLSCSIVPTRYATLVPRTVGGHRGEAPPDTRCGLALHVTPAIASSLAELVTADAALLVQVKAVGGAVNDAPSDATAYAHRHQNFCLIAIGLRENRDLLWTAWDRISPLLDGAYSAFETERGPLQTLAAYPAATLARLADVKAKFDPNNLFEPNFVWR